MRFKAAAIFVGIALAMWQIAWTGWNLIGPMIERAVLPPLYYWDVVEDWCEGDDAILQIELHKRDYELGPGETEARYIGGVMRTIDGDILDVAPASRPDLVDGQGKVTYPPGTSRAFIIAYDGCARTITYHTDHISPLTGLKIGMTWGPFSLADHPILDGQLEVPRVDKRGH